MSNTSTSMTEEPMDLLDQVEDGHTIAHGREEVSSVGAEEQVALAIDGPQ